MRFGRTSTLSLLSLGIVWSLGWGCSSKDDGSTFSTGTGSNAAGTSSTTGSGPSGAGGSIGTSSSISTTTGIMTTGTTGTGTGSGGTGVNADAACAAQKEGTHAVPTDVLILQDKSGSMTCPASDDMCQTAPPNSPPPSRWDAMGMALNGFVNAPGPAMLGVGVGLTFFGVATGGGLGGNVSCNQADYAKPVVPIAPLPGNAMAITNAIAMNMPAGGTPTLPALQGAITAAKAYTTQQMGMRTAAVLLVTDGVPTGCNGNTIPAIAMLAQQAYMGTPPIKTFVVGMGDTAALDQVALAGSGGMTHYIPTAGDVAGALTTALTQITGMITCQYPIPKSGADSSKVNIEITTGQAPNTMVTEVGKVDNMAACGTKVGWYFDNPAMPTQIILCPSACDAAKADPSNTSVDVLFGCPSRPPQ